MTSDDSESLRWYREMADRWAGYHHERHQRRRHDHLPPPDLDMRVYAIVSGKYSLDDRGKILSEVLAHRQTMAPQSLRELKAILVGRAAKYRARAEQCLQLAQRYEALLAQLEDTNVVEAPALKLLK